jgi:hypothetical protein
MSLNGSINNYKELLDVMQYSMVEFQRRFGVLLAVDNFVIAWLTFKPNDGSNKFLRNIGELLSVYTAS